jgi:hypothetical protein
MDEREFRPLPLYWGIAGICILLALLLAWEFWQTSNLGALLFLLIMLSIALWSCDSALSRVFLSTSTLQMTTPLRGGRSVELRQLVSVVESGRIAPVVALLYHPRGADGLLDLDQVQSLTLPVLQNQAELCAALQRGMPL